MREATQLQVTTNARVSGDYFTDSGISIYFPYSDNFGGSNEPIAVVAADQDTGGKWVQDPRCDDTRDGYQYCSQQMFVNDDYADAHPSHIVLPNPAEFSESSNLYGGSLNKVWLGWVRCGKQYDRLISFSGNGGGSELKAMRINGYLKTDNQQITTYEDNLTSIGQRGEISRKQIKNRDWIRVYGFFDTDWETDNKEQALAIFEEDTQSEGKVEGSLTTKASSLEVKPFSFSVTVKTQDEIPVIFTVDRTFLFNDGRNNQRHGFQDSWPIYDGDGPVSYTLPFENVSF